MISKTLFVFLFTVSVLAGSGHQLSPSVRIPPVFIHDGDAIYDVPRAKLRSIMTCPGGNPTSNLQPILLVHGADSTGSESWSGGFVPALATHGYAPCYLDLPQRATGDMQTYSAYVAYNLHHLSWLANGSPVLILGHGQANSIIQWALQFYPSTQRVTQGFFGLSPNLAGLEAPPRNEDCEMQEFVDEIRCRPYAWQQRHNSSYYKALHYKYFVAQVPTTLLWSESDDKMQPVERNAQLPGATSIAVQHLCPNRTVTSADMLSDAVMFDLVREALARGGPGSLSRIEPHAYHICGPGRHPHMMGPLPERSWWSRNQILVNNAIPTYAPKVADEPPLKPYAQLLNQ